MTFAKAFTTLQSFQMQIEIETFQSLQKHICTVHKGMEKN